jgi:hypothetical protein
VLAWNARTEAVAEADFFQANRAARQIDLQAYIAGCEQMARPVNSDSSGNSALTVSCWFGPARDRHAFPCRKTYRVGLIMASSGTMRSLHRCQSAEDIAWNSGVLL